MRVKWLRAALVDLDDIADYIAQDNPDAAERIVVAIMSAAGNLEQFPAAGRPGRVPGTRELVVSGTPYIVPYRVRYHAVQLLRVVYAARKWPTRF